MTRISHLLSKVIDENIIIVTVGEKPNHLLFHGVLSHDEYKRLMNDNPRWMKLKVVHIAPDGNILRVSVKKKIIVSSFWGAVL